ncbi:MAG TPA: triose-phosphate isomerase [Usitatibacter sp.]|jgi:triosephosphate isomerase|nr:triose-phosphate isomerase [Usitatibacter sp.]
MRSRLVAGNWKLNGSLAANEALLRACLQEIPRDAKAACAVCVPYPYLAQARDLLRGSGIAWGAQDCSRHEKGAYTGDVSGAMIAEFGARYAIVGHSERRTLFGDTDAIVVEKFAAAKRAGLTPIFCVGETLGEREGNATDAVLARQLDALVAKGAGELAGAVIAYEPVWAIGTGRTATSQQAQQAHDFIRRRVAAKDAQVAARVPILYGGSVKAANAAELFAMPDVDGGLVGGASLVAEEFVAIWRAAGAQVKG